MPRAPATPEQARQIVDALIARQFEGELPSLSSDEVPLRELLPLHGRALFAAASLTPEVRLLAAETRERFFDALGQPFGLSARVLLGAVRARTFPPAPPREIVDYEYLGKFSCAGTLDIADPYHLRKSGGILTLFTTSHTVEAHEGPWHAYVRDGGDESDRRTAELVVIHELGFDLAAVESVGNIPVDAGMAGVFDRECPLPAPTELYVEGVVHGRGAFSRSGWGDGIYPLLVARARGRVAKLRIPFFDEDDGEDREVDMTLPRRPSQPYAASKTFVVGDTVDHVKFGNGTVIAIVDGKISVQFADETRTLVHGRR